MTTIITMKVFKFVLNVQVLIAENKNVMKY